MRRRSRTLMAAADLQGSDGHGVSRLPQYVRRIKAGGFNVRPNIHVVHEHAATAVLNGDNGMGHLVMKRAAEMAVEKARITGIGWVNSQFSNHAGPASLYATMPLAHDMIGLYFAVGNANHLPPWGGLDMLLSTNPIAAAIPAGEENPVRARHGDDGRRLRQGEDQGAARRDHAGGLDDRPRRQAADRSEARRRRHAAAARRHGGRLQRLRPCDDHRPARGHARRRRDGPRRRSTSTTTTTASPIPDRRSPRSTSQPSATSPPSSEASMRWSATSATASGCPASTASGCPANAAMKRGSNGPASAFRWPPRCGAAWTRSPTTLELQGFRPAPEVGHSPPSRRRNHPAGRSP